MQLRFEHSAELSAPSKLSFALAAAIILLVSRCHTHTSSSLSYRSVVSYRPSFLLMASETEVVGPPIDNADRDKEALQYYTARVALMDQVIKLRPNAPGTICWQAGGLTCEPHTCAHIARVLCVCVAAPQPLRPICTPSRATTTSAARSGTPCSSSCLRASRSLPRASASSTPAVARAPCPTGRCATTARELPRYDTTRTHVRARARVRASALTHSLSLAQAYGFDLTPALLEVAQARVQGPVFWTGDICEPASYAPVPAASLDLIVCFGVFIHLRSHAHAEQAMRNMYGTLKPGGTLFIGYNMDAYNRQEAEASRQKSQRYVPQSAAGRSVLDSLTARSLPAARSSRSCSAPCRRTSTAATSLCVLLLACLLACSLAWPN